MKGNPKSLEGTGGQAGRDGTVVTAGKHESAQRVWLLLVRGRVSQAEPVGENWSSDESSVQKSRTDGNQKMSL